MNNKPHSFAEVEQLLAELARHDRHALQHVQAERLRRLAGAEVHRVFRRRRLLRAAGSTATLALVAGALTLLLPEVQKGTPTALPLAAKPSPAVKQLPIEQLAKTPESALPQAHVRYEARPGVQFEANCLGAYEIVIYPVPL